MKRVCLVLTMVLAAACTEEQSTEPNPPDTSDTWVTIGADLPGYVTSLCVASGELIASTFEDTDDRLAAVLWSWDDSTWTQVAPALSDRVDRMMFYRDAIVVGGWFEIDQDPPIRGLAKWNGESWSPAGGSLESPHGFCILHIHSMLLWRDHLAISGGFSREGNLAIWDGDALQIVPEVPVTTSLTVWRDTLIAGVRSCGDVLCPSGSAVLSWDGERLSDFGGWADLVHEECPPFVTIASVLAIDQGVVVSSNSHWGDHPVENIVMWTGNEWRPMGTSSRYVGRLLQIDGHLVVVASEPYPLTNQLLSWDGEGWAPVGTALDGYINDLVVFEGNLVVGGDFTGNVASMSLDQFEE